MIFSVSNKIKSNMAEFNFLNLELMAFIVVMLVYTNIRKRSQIALNLVNNLTVYIPPQKEDFEML